MEKREQIEEELYRFVSTITQELKNSRDVERGSPNSIYEEPWQTCSCLGGWHYDTRLAENINEVGDSNDREFT